MAEVFQKLAKDPTKTVGVRKRWMTQFNKRFTQLKGRINRLLIKGVEGNIPVPQINEQQLVINQFEFESNPQSVARFMAWLQLQVNDLLFTNDATPADIWQNKFIDQSYLRGIKLTQAELRKSGITAVELQQLQAATIVGVQAVPLGIATSVIGLDLKTIHLDAIRLLYTREFAALRGITDTMSGQIARVMVEGVEQGFGVRQIAKNINDRVDKIGLTRSKLLARTETARAYNIGTVNEFKDVASQLGVETQFEWITAGDGRVRPTHVDRNGKIFSESQALALIGEPNCRCALKAHIDPELLKAA